MGRPVTAMQIYPALKALFGLPDMCTKFELRVHHNDVVTIDCQYYLSLDAPGIAQLAEVFGEYDLVPRTKLGDAEPHPCEVIGFDAWMRERAEAAHQAMMKHARRGVAYPVLS
jgi:hypothetical protein